MSSRQLGRRWRSRYADLYYAWHNVAKELGAKYVAGALQWTVDHGIVTLRTRSAGETYAYEMRAPFWNPRGVHFHIFPMPRSAFRRFLRRFFGAGSDVKIGDLDLDRLYYFDTDSPIEVQGLVSEPRIRELLVQLRDVTVHVRDGSRSGNFPEGVDELWYPIPWPPYDELRQRRMFELCSEMLRYFGEEGADYEDRVQLNVKRLEAPGGRIRRTNGLVLWDGDASRMRAAEALGQPGNVRAVPSLMRALDDPSRKLRLKAIRALREIGDGRPVKALIPLLVQRGDVVHGDLGDAAAETLTSIGAGPLVNAIDEALSGNTDPLCDLAGEHRKEVIEVILGALKDPKRRVFGHAFRTLADLGAVETLPTLRKKAKEVTISALATTCRDAISDLESLQSLPRPATSPQDPGKTLPRAAIGASTNPPTLPRSATEKSGEFPE